MDPPPPQATGRSGGNARGWIVFAAIALIGVGGYFAYRQFVAGRTGGGGGSVVARVDGGQVVASVTPPVVPRPTEPAGGLDAGAATAVPPVTSPEVKKPVAPDAPLRFESDPPGADVYLDGALKGKTPFEMPGSGDRHKVAMILQGHALYRGEVDGSGLVKVPLAAVHAGAGEGKIKVRCRTRNRLYIIVDGAPTGEICPTERIQTKIGDITVETYDPVTDSSRTHKVSVKKKSGGSLRVHLDD
jgi:hypothetical protein